MEVSYQASGAEALVPLVIMLAIVLFMVVAMWKVFTKGGQPGWGCLIPIYNTYLMLLIAGKPGWWLLLLFIPGVNVIIGIITLVAFADSFGKGVGFALGLIFLPIIFYPILAFGSAQHVSARQHAAPAVG